jgi:hypothetical protein
MISLGGNVASADDEDILLRVAEANAAKLCGFRKDVHLRLNRHCCADGQLAIAIQHGAHL